MSKPSDSFKMRVFRCSGDVPINDHRLDDNMVKILSVLDGRKSIASIAFASGMTMSDFQKAIKNLIELDLIEAAKPDEILSE
jgi:aminopeptidase-like protein